MPARPASPIDRRRFLTDAARAAAGCAVAGTLLALYARDARALPAEALRPPGALAEDDFLGACIRCGLCVRACPYDTLSLAELGEGPATGTPFFTARRIPCEMCDDIPYVVACPTGALDPGLTDIDRARMGIAVLVDQENFLNLLGLRCDVCYRVCPAIDRAITLESQHNPRSGHHAMFLPTVHADHCTGCGKCEQSCVLPEAAIKVLPARLARATPADHQRALDEGKTCIDCHQGIAHDLPANYLDRYQEVVDDLETRGVLPARKAPDLADIRSFLGTDTDG